MPAVRASSTAKAARYERTHEENQERAYIAASRRSDRCIEARMESARRASDIHQKRTGRALRVTEAEVSNEEMYEEITDLPSDYRRLNAHLKTGSEDFDRRLLAYLTSQVSMRGAIQQAVSNGRQDGQSGVDAGFISPSVLQSTPLPQQYLTGDTMMPPHIANAPSNSFRQTPYPMGLREPQPGQHVTHAPMASPREASFTQGDMGSNNAMWLDNGRRASFQVDATPQASHSPTKASTTSRKSSTSILPRVDSATGHAGTYDSFQQTALHNMDQPNAQSRPVRTAIESLTEPLSITIPLENQQIIVSNLHGRGSPSTDSPRHDFTDRRYSYNPNGRAKPTPDSSIRSPSMSLSTQIPSSHLSLSQTPSPLWLDSNSNSRPSTPYDNAFTQACYDHSGMGPYGTFTENLPLGKTKP